MQDLLQKILTQTKVIPNNKNLESILFVRIQKRIQLITRIKFFSYLTLGILSGVSLYFYAGHLYQDMINSGIYNYLHLIFGEDFYTLTILSKEMLYAVFESLPVMSMTLSLGILFTLMVSINGILISLRKNIFLKNY